MAGLCLVQVVLENQEVQQKFKDSKLRISRKCLKLPNGSNSGVVNHSLVVIPQPHTPLPPAVPLYQ